MDSRPKTDSFFQQSCLCLCLPAPDVWVRSGEWSVFRKQAMYDANSVEYILDVLPPGKPFVLPIVSSILIDYPTHQPCFKKNPQASKWCYKSLLESGIHLVGRIVITTSLASGSCWGKFLYHYNPSKYVLSML